MGQVSEDKAPIDLYLSDWPILHVSTKDFFEYEPPSDPSGNDDKDEHTSCDNLIKTSQLGTANLGSYIMSPGKRFCLQTSQNRVALITLGELIDDGYDLKGR